jgi:putative nucleotidyltransferase with HDIG domain
MKDSLRNLLGHMSRFVARSGLPDGNAARLAHPSEDTLEEYCFNRLPEDEASWLEEHILVCEQCQDRLEEVEVFLSMVKHALQNSNDSESGKAGEARPSLRQAGRPAVVNQPELPNTASFDRMSGPEQPVRLPPCFFANDLLAARERLPVSHLVVSRCLSAMHRENASLNEIETIASQDPAIAAHLVRVANSALLSSGHQIRSVARAIMQIGFQKTKMHIWGVSMKSSYGSTQLKEVWNHSIEVAQTARKLAELSQVTLPEEACLAGLVHDIGCLVLVGLGRSYETKFAQLRTRGAYPVEIERRLCGSDHAQIGADLLESWSFPADMVESVRYHHSPSGSTLALASLMFVAESWVENDEDAYDRNEHSFALRCLNLTGGDLPSIRDGDNADLALLRFAA